MSVFNSMDWGVIVLFFIGMITVVWYSMRTKVQSGEDYFLSGRSAGWLQIGSSIYSSNIGSEHLVGLAGAGFATGMAMAHWEMQGWMILVLGWVFVPIYDRIKVFTMPEFLERRFSPGSRSILSFLTIASLVLTKIAATLYAADVVFKVLLGRDHLLLMGHNVDMFWVIALGLAIATGIYTALGGLRVIMYTAVLQTPVLLFGSICILFIGLHKLGAGHLIAGWKVMLAAGQNTHLIRPLNDGTGHLWLFNKFPVARGPARFGDHRVLVLVYRPIYRSTRTRGKEPEGESSRFHFRRLSQAYAGLYFPCSRHGCVRIDKRPLHFTTSGDAAYTSLVAQILPHGIRGIVACGMLPRSWHRWHPSSTLRQRSLLWIFIRSGIRKLPAGHRSLSAVSQPIPSFSSVSFGSRS